MGGLPFGGVKESGFGKEHALVGFDEYCSMKSVYVDITEGEERARPVP
jgi:acyl-CoA reductase-like NAD-dependent aldehyde dehydrogenase